MKKFLYFLLLAVISVVLFSLLGGALLLIGWNFGICRLVPYFAPTTYFPMFMTALFIRGIAFIVSAKATVKEN